MENEARMEPTDAPAFPPISCQASTTSLGAANFSLDVSELDDFEGVPEPEDAVRNMYSYVDEILNESRTLSHMRSETVRGGASRNGSNSHLDDGSLPRKKARKRPMVIVNGKEIRQDRAGSHRCEYPACGKVQTCRSFGLLPSLSLSIRAARR